MPEYPPPVECSLIAKVGCFDTTSEIATFHHDTIAIPLLVQSIKSPINFLTYVIFLRPILTYKFLFCCSLAVINANDLDDLQNHILRIMAGAPWVV